MRLPQISVLWLKLFYKKRRDESALCITNTGYDLCAKTAPNNFPGGKKSRATCIIAGFNVI